MNIGENIKQKRKEAGLTQAALASKLGVSRTAVSSWEVNRNEPCVRDIEKMAEIFECLKTDIIGSGPVEYYFVSSVDEKLLIDAYRNSDEETKKMVQRLLAYATKINDLKVKEDNDD